MIHQNTENQLCRLFEAHFGQLPTMIHSLPDSGSQRKYFFLSNTDFEAIGTLNEQIEENEAFFHLANAMQLSAVASPEIYIVSEDRRTYLQQNLGNETLFSLLENNRNTTEFEIFTEEKFQKSLVGLAKFQHVTKHFVDPAKCWPATNFDQLTILSDLHYFFYYFVKQQTELNVNEYRLMKEFVQFAKLFEAVPSNFLMYRDFQSRNIMWYNEKPYFIDFQGARLGPLQYDLVSLLYQAKAGLKPDMRQRLTDFYTDIIAEVYDSDPVVFRQHLPYFVYLRLMQVLGAYGFRGLIQKKQHFIQSIPFALNELKNQLQLFPLNDQFAYLKSVLLEVSSLSSKFQPHRSVNKKGVLTVAVNSFSYKKKGIPPDHQGNGGGFVFDCRILPNPGRYPEYTSLTGLDKEVVLFLEKEQDVAHYLKHVKAIVAQGVTDYLARGFSALMVSFGCTGGQHRSVYCAATIAQWLIETFPEIEVELKHHEQNLV